MVGEGEPRSALESGVPGNRGPPKPGVYPQGNGRDFGPAFWVLERPPVPPRRGSAPRVSEGEMSFKRPRDVRQGPRATSWPFAGLCPPLEGRWVRGAMPRRRVA